MEERQNLKADVAARIGNDAHDFRHARGITAFHDGGNDGRTGKLHQLKTSEIHNETKTWFEDRKRQFHFRVTEARLLRGDVPAIGNRQLVRRLIESDLKHPLFFSVESAANDAGVAGDHQHRKKHNQIIHIQSPFPGDSPFLAAERLSPFGFGCAEIAGRKQAMVGTRNDQVFPSAAQQKAGHGEKMVV